MWGGVLTHTTTTTEANEQDSTLTPPAAKKPRLGAGVTTPSELTQKHQGAMKETVSDMLSQVSIISHKFFSRLPQCMYALEGVFED